MDKRINIFMTAIQYPCGEGSSCCGPVGQKHEEIVELKNAITEKFSCDVGIYDIKSKEELKNFTQVNKLIRGFGMGILPVVAINDEVISMGTMKQDDIIKLLSDKIKV
ncbi:MAG: hypothetical protein N2645_19835 [Clostridia bacterium]|nr:hypothetical protein [Clostridia bacterium]